MYGKDNHIITKHVTTGPTMPSARLYNDLDFIDILLLDVIIYDTPRNHVPLCLLFA
jgi:hypothetical protein